MKLTTEDQRLLEEICLQHGVSADKVLKLLDTARDYRPGRSFRAYREQDELLIPAMIFRCHSLTENQFPTHHFCDK
ncbi:MAG: DNA modification system-associated small protein [Desulfatirhabdiaceae bacterium]